MIELLSNNLFHALTTKNERLLGYLIDENCVFDTEENETIEGKEAVIHKLSNFYYQSKINLVEVVKDDQDKLTMAYHLFNDEDDLFGSLVIHQNKDRRIDFLKNTIVSKIHPLMLQAN